MNYTTAYEVALQKFQTSDLADLQRYSGYSIKDNHVLIEFLGQKFTVEHPNGIFAPEPLLDGELPIFARILILHYLLNKSDALETGKLISYKEIPGGSIYIQPFTKRAIRPFVQHFGENPKLLLEVAAKLGGVPVKHGDAGIMLRAFPRIPVTLVLWQGDDEFPASGNILFDSSASTILPAEDYAVLASFVVRTLIKRSIL